MKVTLTDATVADVSKLVNLRLAVSERLRSDLGPGIWATGVTEKGILFAMRSSRVLVVRDRERIVGSLRLGTKKPWAIDKSYFTECARPLYLTDMHVAPDRQRCGIGRAMLLETADIARAWPADAIRLDAFDLPAGAGEFYAKCGFREMGRATYRSAPLIYYELLLPPHPAKINCRS
jgi:GNAT superfamily N-acetyltransferase